MSKSQCKSRAGKFAAYIKLLRPKQWTKNLFIFLAPLFGFNGAWMPFLNAGFAFVLFCGLSSAFYIINDCYDLASDRAHPIKRNRPLASGQVPIVFAKIVAAVLILISMTGAYFVAPFLIAVFFIYAALQLAYNAKLKHVAIIDVFCISFGFVLRAFAGSVASGIHLSSWFLLCTIMLTLYLGVEKRKAEFLMQGNTSRPVLENYTYQLLSKMENTAVSGTLMSYCLWSAGPLLGGASTPWMMSTVPFVLFGMFRYQLLSEQAQYKGDEAKGVYRTEKPEEALLTDKPLLITVILWGLAVMAILCLRKLI